MKAIPRAILVAAAVVGVLAALLCGLGALDVSGGSDSDLTYNSLDYDVQVRKDGSLRIEQVVDVRLGERDSDDDGEARPWKQLYQRYTLNSANLTDITDVSVERLPDGTGDGSGQDSAAAKGEAYTETDPALPSGVDTDSWDRRYAGHWYLATASPKPATAPSG
ncbi:MAG: hypothetical protein UHD09_03470 [Bifidobacterium sp.]|nr:hypothetical protein [Bifidobacterium sp.]